MRFRAREFSIKAREGLNMKKDRFMNVTTSHKTMILIFYRAFTLCCVPKNQKENYYI